MENYKAILKKRIQLFRIAISFSSMLCALHVIDLLHPFTSEHYYSFIEGTLLGTSLGIMVFAVIWMRKYSVALKDEHKLITLYNAEHDERTQYIQNKSGGMILVICALIIFGVALVIGFFNFSAFVTLIVVAYFLLIVKLFLKFYYGKKY